MIKNKNYYCVILAGGIGSRFWPISTKSRPKQFYDILGLGKTLIQQTFIRISEVFFLENIFVVTYKNYKSLIYNQLSKLPKSNLLLEPFIMNTASSIAYASFKISIQNKDACILIAPSDHLITNEKQFYKILNLAFQEACKMEYLITLGIKPLRPDTSYGYIQFISEYDTSYIKKVKYFIEKPSYEIAIKIFKLNNFLWNSGMFICNIQTILKSFKKYLPEMYSFFYLGKKKINTKNEYFFIKSIFPNLQKISIDYGILEKADNIYVIPSHFGWSDLGSWSILYEKNSKDYLGNIIKGKKIIFYESYDNIIYLNNNKVAIIDGLNGYIVVDTLKALLICRKEKDQEIKQFVNDLNLTKNENFL